LYLTSGVLECHMSGPASRPPREWLRSEDGRASPARQQGRRCAGRDAGSRKEEDGNHLHLGADLQLERVQGALYDPVGAIVGKSKGRRLLAILMDEGVSSLLEGCRQHCWGHRSNGGVVTGRKHILYIKNMEKTFR
jgi:hypothetical protein